MKVKFWPGDDMERNLVPGTEYEQISKTRVEKLQEFITSDSFPRVLLKACLSSLPRWKYVQQMDRMPRPKEASGQDHDEEQSDASDEEYEHYSIPKNMKGVSRGQGAFLNEARRIMSGSDDLVEYFLPNNQYESVIRLEVWRSICASALYLSDRNYPFATRL